MEVSAQPDTPAAWLRWKEHQLHIKRYVHSKAKIFKPKIWFATSEIYTIGVHKFPRKLGANTKFQAPEGWHEATCTLKTQEY
jgi:hypothetical protein